MLGGRKKERDIIHVDFDTGVFFGPCTSPGSQWQCGIVNTNCGGNII